MDALKHVSKKWQALGLVVILTGIVVASVMYRSPTTPKASTTSDIEFLGNVTRIGFAYIKDANYDFDPKKPAPPVPVVLKNLEGKQVEITGYAMPLYNPDGKAEFFLTQAANGCCFGAPPQLQHMVLVRAADPKLKLEDISHPVKVRGTFSVGEEKDSYGYVTSLIRITADSIEGGQN